MPDEIPRIRLNELEYKLIMQNRGVNVDTYDTVDSWLLEMPDGKEEVQNDIIIHGKTGVLCDIHLGFHDKLSLATAVTFLKKEGVDNIVLNGDTIDAHRLSKWNKTEEDTPFSMELALCRNFMKNLQSTFPDAKLYFKIGNHEDRLQQYLQRNALEIAGLIDYDYLLELSRNDIHLVESLQYMKIGSTYLLHGHEIKATGANPAAVLLNKVLTNCVIGHVHKTDVKTKKTAEGKYIKCYTVGTLGKTVRAYHRQSDSNNGFAIIEADGYVRNFRIESGIVIQ